MHNTTNHKPANRAAGKMQPHPLLQTKVLLQPPLRKKVGGQLHTAAKASPDHSGTHTPIQSLEPFSPANSPEAVNGVTVFVLRAHRKERGVRLQPRLHEEEW